MEIPPQVAKLDAKFGDLRNKYQQHEMYREMRNLAIKLEEELEEYTGRPIIKIRLE